MGNNTSSSSSIGGGSRSNNASYSNTSSSSSQHHSISHSLPSFRRTTGVLGLSKSELDKRCKPSGLYPTTPWEEKAIRRLIADGKLACRLRGADSRKKTTDRECPICFLHYSQINVTACCRAFVCTECYLQIRPQREKMVGCPFCNYQKLVVSVARTMEETEALKREEEEQVVIESIIRKRVEEDCASNCKSLPTEQEQSKTPGEAKACAFGSSLDQYVNQRSDSCISDTSSEVAPISLMSPDERTALEEEMKQQHQHPLARKLQREAEERRSQNDLQYRSTNSGRIRTANSAALLHRSLQGRRGRGARRERDWNQIVEAFENDLGTEVQSLDDLVVIEAAILLSMEEEAQRRRARRDGEEEYEGHPIRPGGFPLLQAIMSRRAEESEDDSDDGIARARRLRRGRRYNLEDAMGGSVAASTAGLLMRGVSEEEQIAMAIAMSLRDQESQEPRQQETGDGEDVTRTTEDTASAAVSDSPMAEFTNSDQLANASSEQSETNNNEGN